MLYSLSHQFSPRTARTFLSETQELLASRGLLPRKALCRYAFCRLLRLLLLIGPLLEVEIIVIINESERWKLDEGMQVFRKVQVRGHL